MKYHFKVHKEKKYYWAECLELEGCRSQGKSIDELALNCKEALELYISEPEDSKLIMNFPIKKNSRKKSVMAVSLNSRVAFAFMLRQLRLRGPKTQKKMQDLLGFQNLFSYQVLENPKKANPTLETISKIYKKFPELNLNEILEAS